jgi:hypothetical protein
VERYRRIYTETESISGTESSEDLDIEEDFIVRKLLRPGCVPIELEGRQGTATDGVDTFFAFFVLGFDNNKELVYTTSASFYRSLDQ